MTRQSYGSHKHACAILLTLSMLFAVVSRASGQTATLSSTSRNFRQVAVGGTSTANVTLSNTSTTTALAITSIVASGPPFSETNTCGSSLAAGGSCRITITFAPTALGAATGSVVVTDNASPATQTVTLSGTGIGVITDSTTSVNFGSTAVGGTSATRRIGLTNNSGAAVPLSIASSSAEFPETNTCGTSLAAFASCTISVTFVPTAIGAQTGSITTSYTGVGSPLTVALTGTGAAPVTITPTSHNFGNVGVGQTSATFSFTVHNGATAAQPLTISTSAPFAEASTTCGSSLAGSSTCTVSVTFDPTAAGAASGSLTVSYGGTTNATSTLTGNGTTPIRVGPNPVNFSTSLQVGAASQPHTVTITNNTSTAVALDSIVASPAAYAITSNSCGGSVAANSSCTLTIVFTPAVLGTTAGTLTVTYGSTNVQITVPMTGGASVNRLLSLVITEPSTSLAAGATEQLTATGTFANGSTANVTTAAAWSSSNTAVATVGSTTGLVTGVGAGTTVITAAVAGTNNGTVQNTANLTVTASQATLTGITLTATQGSTTPIAPPTLAAGSSDQVYATGTYSNNTTQDITSTATWASSNTADATVSGGLVTAVAAGTATISASVGAINNSTTATITAATLTSITLTATQGGTTPIAAPTLAVGTTDQVYATGTYSNGSTQDITATATWASSSASATVAGGLITGVSTGTATISATLSGIANSTTATITPATLQSISITPGTATVAAGNTQQFTATGTYSDKSTQNITANVTWSSSNAGVTMSTTTAGLATATDTAIGQISNISASMGGVTAATPAVLTVGSAALVSIAVTPANPSIADGTTEAFTATGTYSDDSTQNLTSTVTWSATTASGGGAATFSTTSLGVAKATAQGTVMITATSGAISGSTTLTVTAPVLTSIVVTNVTPANPPVAGSPAVVTIHQGQTEQFYALGTYSDSSIQDITSQVAWSTGSTTIATVSTSGATAGLATGVGAGTVPVTASFVATGGTITSTGTGGDGTLTVIGLSSIALTPANPTAALGDANTSIAAGASNYTLQFTATANFADNTTQNVTTSATWTSGTTTVATIGGTTGLATVIAVGTSTITATYAGVSGNTLLTVAPAVLTSIVVTNTVPATPPVAGPPAVVTIYQGQTEQFYAVGTYSDSSTQNITSTVAWSAGTGTGTVATVSTSGATAGLATAVAAGTVEISATLGTITSGAESATLTVTGLNSVTVTPSNPTAALGDANTGNPFGATNDTLQFTATAAFADNTTQNVTAAATWTSGTTTVATIGGTTGLATVIAVGTSTVTATYAGVSGNTLLTVTPAILESITVAPAGVTLGLNGTQQFTATGNYSDGTTADLTQTATWASFNGAVVTVNATGLATVVATPTPNVAVAITASSGSVAPFGATNTAFVSTSTTLPIVCTSPTIDMKLLVVNNEAAGYVDFPAIQQILNFVGTPYDVVDVSGAAPTLSDGACHAHYQGVIFANGGDYYLIPTWQAALISFEQTFNIRQVNWYDAPDPNFGFSSTVVSQIPSNQNYNVSFTGAAAPIFFYANLATPVTITGAFIDLASPLSPMPSGAVFTPLMADASGNIVSATYTFNAQQFLTQTFDSSSNNAFMLEHDLVVAYGLLNWVTKGVFLGDYHVYATQEIDDFFIDDSEWIPSTTCLSNPLTLDRTAPDSSNLPIFRVNSTDMSQLVAWQQAKQADPLLGQFKLTMAFNGVGTVGNGDWTGLVAPIVSSSATGGVASFTALDFSGQVGDTVTVANTTNGGGVLNGTYTITSVTPSAAMTPGRTTFTVNVGTTSTIGLATELGTDDNSASPTVSETTDSLVANLQQYQGSFHWISHTYDHPNSLNGLCQSTPSTTTPLFNCGNTTDIGDDIELEVLTNDFVASNSLGVNLDTDLCTGTTGQAGYCDTVNQLTFTDFNNANIVTPGVSGLNDPNVPGYLYGYGIRYAVSDTSVATTTNPPNNNGPNPSPNVGIVNSYEPLLYEVPRHPNDVFYNAANWGDDQAEFDCIYTYYVPPGSPAGTVPKADPPFNTYDAAQVLDFTSTAFVSNMLMGDMDPEMFHQPDLHFSNNAAALSVAPVPTTLSSAITGLTSTSTHVSSLITDTYDQTFYKYELVYKLPVLTPTLDQLGVLMQNRNAFNLSGVTASIVNANTSSATITLTMPTTATVSSAVIPVTGTSAGSSVTGSTSEVYGGQNISHISMTPGQTIILP